jgi:hypothetical protein
MIGAERSATACSLNERLWNGKRSPRFHEGEPHARRGCPLSAEQRKTFAHAELSHFDPKQSLHRYPDTRDSG